MYEYLKKYINVDSNGKHRFFKVEEGDIEQAEKRMGFEFPNCIKEFYREIGYGFIGKDPNFYNRIMHPNDIADFVCDDEVYEYVDKSLYDDDELVFMHIDSEDFVTIKCSGESEGKIMLFGKKIANSFEELIEGMYKNPDYIHLALKNSVRE